MVINVNYGATLLKTIIVYCVISFLLLIAAVSGVIGYNPLTLDKCKSKKLYVILVVRVFLPLIYVAGAIWISGSPISDYIFKDYKTGRGTLLNINTPASIGYITVSQFVVKEDEGPFYIPKEFIRKVDEGDKYKFIYANRSRIIVEIERDK